MNKQKAIDILKWIKEKLVISKDFKEAIDMAIEALQFQDIMINNPKTAKPTPEVCRTCMDNKQDNWIPVSERLPEDREDVLVYLSSARIAIASYNEHKLPFRNTAMGWGYRPLNGHIDWGKENVIAWQPLPESYRPEGEDK